MAEQNISGLLDQLGKTALECRGLIREMHEAQQDLNRTIKDAKGAKDVVDKYLTTDIQNHIEAQLDNLGSATKLAIDESAKKIIKEFDKLAKPLMAAMEDINQYVVNLRAEVDDVEARIEKMKREVS